MAVKTVIVSDISGDEIEEESHSRVIVSDHPKLNGSAVELDITNEEAARLQSSKLDLVNLLIMEPNRPPRRVLMDAADLSAMFAGVDFEAVFDKGRRANEERPRSRQRRSGPGGSSKPERLDYTDMDNIGLEHRGRVTETEARLVRENLDRANANRQRQGRAPIDPSDEKMKRRYGF